MSAKLVFVGTNNEILLENRPLLIGRSIDADIRLPVEDVFLSRKQAQIEPDEEGYLLMHLGSNPHTTKLNGAYITGQVKLKPGDLIEFGSMNLQFLESAENEEKSVKTNVVFDEDADDNLQEFEQIDSEDLQAESSAIRDALLSGEVEGETARRIQLLFKATSELNPFQGETVLLEKAFEILRDIIAFDTCAILLKNPDSGELEPQIVFPKPTGEENKTGLSVSRSVVRHVMEKEVALYTADIRSDNQFRSQMSVILKNIVSVMCVPLRAEKEILGIWYVDTRSLIKRYTKEHLAFLGIMANFLARSILNLRLVKKVEEQAVFRNTIGRYFSPTIVAELEKAYNDKDFLSGKEAQVCVMFTDVRSFSKISTQMHPRDLLNLLNEHFTLIADAIQELEGTIDKYIGDSVMAFWGAPVAIEHASIRCVQAAVLIQQEMAVLREKLQTDGRVPIHIGIGINTGMAIAGNIGSVKRMDYSLVSDAVNLAERLCEVAQPDQILISRSTFDDVKDYFQGEIRELPSLPLKNIGEVAPYEVVYRQKGL